MKRKILAFILVISVFVLFFTGCSNKRVKLSFITYGPSEMNEPGLAEAAGRIEYNKSLFYRNDLIQRGADPSVIFVTEGEEKGYFYLYATSDEIGATGVQCWRSKDLVNWECRGVAFRPDRLSWARLNYWAPEVIYDEDENLYFMYYCADRISNGVKNIGLATSETPYGPFIQYVNEDEGITLDKPLFDFTKMSDSDPLKEPNGKAMKVIDPSPYKDPDTGEKYLYFVRDLGGGGNSNYYDKSSIFVIKMTDWYHPDYTEVRKLTTVNSLIEDGVESDLNEGHTNEGPFMYKKNGKYYLTYSANEYMQKAYSVRVAVGDSPMGPFTKLTKDQGGWLLYCDAMSDYASGTGHHAFVEAGDELFIVYHAHIDRELGDVTQGRAIACDRVLFVENDNGIEVPYVNGPTYSLQPLAAEISGYKNIAPQAKITASNTAAWSDTKFLNDGVVKCHEDDNIVEYTANGDCVITLSFNDYKPTRAIMIYNSCNYNNAIGAIADIELEFKSDKSKGIAYTGLLLYDWESYCTPDLTMRTGGAFIVEYAELLVKTITITIKNNDMGFALSDIVVLGK